MVRTTVAQKQFAEDEEKRQAEAAARAAKLGEDGIPHANMSGDGSIGAVCTPPATTAGYGNESYGDPVPVAPRNKRFFMSANLDTTRINRDVQKYVEEIIQHLTSESSASVKVSLEVEAQNNEGFSQQTVRTITENCRTLRVRDSGFEE